MRKTRSLDEPRDQPRADRTSYAFSWSSRALATFSRSAWLSLRRKSLSLSWRAGSRHTYRRSSHPTHRAPLSWCSLPERDEISRGPATGMGPRRIAGRLGRSPSTVSREVAHDSGQRRYRAAEADRDPGVIASGKPLSPSTTAIRRSWTLRLRSALITRSQNFAPSVCSIQMPRISLRPEQRIPGPDTPLGC